MKVTLIRTDNKNVPHVTVNTIEKLMTRMQTDTKQQTPAEQYFNDCFEVARDEHEGQFLTSSAIFAHIKKVAGADLRLSSLNHFGRILSNMPEIVRKRTKNGTEYLVKPRK